MSKKHFIIGIIIGIVLLFSAIFSLPDRRLHIVFCDVGQGDAAYIRTPNNMDMLIDGGPNDKVLSCLGEHMPFYDRTIDLVLLTHPQKDHLQGLLSVIERYTVKYFVIGVIGNETEGFQKLRELIWQRNILIKNLYAGDNFKLGEVNFSVLWPEREWVAEHTNRQTRFVASHKPGLEELKGTVLGLQTDSDLNDFSYYLHLTYGTFGALFTGDGDSRVQPDIMDAVQLPQVEVLKFPHHGSKYGVIPEFLDKVSPDIAVISVGKNPWGHPTKETIDLLNYRSIEVKRTDLSGDIEIISDGKNWFKKDNNR